MPTFDELPLRSDPSPSAPQKSTLKPTPILKRSHLRLLTFAFSLYAASTLISMAVMSICAAILGVVLFYVLGGPAGVLKAFRTASRSLYLRRYIQVSGLLLGACAISLIGALIAPLGWGGKFIHPEFFSDMAKSWYFVWPVLLVLGLHKLGSSERQVILRTWILTMGLMSCVGIVQHYTGWPRPQSIPESGGYFHATMFLGHHLSVASIFIFPLFATLDFLKKRDPVLPSGVLLVCALLGLSTLFLTYSRMLWIALPLGIVAWVVRSLPVKRALIAVALIVLGVSAAFQIPVIHHRALHAMGIGDRQALWKANLEFLDLRPLTGTGFRRNIEASTYYLESLPNEGWVFSGHAHNNFIDMLGGTGLLGAGTWLLWCAMVFWILRGSLWREIAPQYFVSGLICAWVVFHLNGLTQVNFWEGKVMHQMMWVMAWSLLWVTEREPPVTSV